MDFPFLKKWAFFFLIPSALAQATLVGNPGQPGLQNTGIIRESPSEWSFRLSYFGDYVYKEQFHDEFKIRNCVQSSSNIQLWTQAAMLTFNVRERLDLYAICGGSRIEIDQDIYTNQQLSWGIGGKLVIIHEERFRLGLDVKYFASNLRPRYLICDSLPYNIFGDFYFGYQEIQAGMGVSYRWKYLSPYLNATYLISKIVPQPDHTFLVRLPEENSLIDVTSKSVVGTRRWGLAVGATLIDNRKGSLALEWRAFNQNAINLNGEIRF